MFRRYEAYLRGSPGLSTAAQTHQQWRLPWCSAESRRGPSPQLAPVRPSRIPRVELASVWGATDSCPERRDGWGGRGILHFRSRKIHHALRRLKFSVCPHARFGWEQIRCLMPQKHHLPLANHCDVEEKCGENITDRFHWFYLLKMGLKQQRVKWGAHLK